DKEIKRVFDDYIAERKFVPDYANFLAKENPEFLIKWFDTRRIFRGRGVLPEKFKELLLMACNSIRLNENSVRMHMQVAMDMGATKEEILEAAMCVWLVGGMTSFNNCVRSLMKVLEKEE
ncbi:MAG: carboxymuconolactone decarboxylase family protein, partial [Candidatus Hodarchaeota archaeon]